MNKRISQKVFKRANKKIYAFLNNKNDKSDKRTTYEIAKEEPILSDLERRIFLQRNDAMNRLTDSIIAELKAEGSW